MAETSKKERILAGAVALFMLISTVGTYAVMIMSSSNPQPVSDAQKAQNQKTLEEYVRKMEKRAAEANKMLSKKNYPVFKKYQNANAKFDSSKVTKLEQKDLEIGKGKEIKELKDGSFYYIGWLADGTVFDSSFEKDGLKAPFSSQNAIEGWQEGVKGMKPGGVRQLTIPANLAYGDKDSGKIPANSVLRFVIMAAKDLTEKEIAKLPKVSY